MWTILAMIVIVILFIICDEPEEKVGVFFIGLILWGFIAFVSVSISTEAIPKPTELKVVEQKLEYDFSIKLDDFQQSRADLVTSSGGKVKFLKLEGYSKSETNWWIWPFMATKTVEPVWVVTPYDMEVDL